MSSDVSVVVPTYERPDFLPGAIETVINQTEPPTEVVVVDDGSSERYAQEVVEQYPPSVRCVRHDENRGLSAARNTGIEESSGEFIAFLDDDDRWHETKLSKQTAELERDDSAGMATCLVASITPDGDLVHCESEVPTGDCSEQLLTTNPIGTPSRILVRREAIATVGGFDESLPTKQDWDFYLRLCQEYRVAGADEHLCFRTFHESMSSSTTAIERDKRAILEKHEDLIRSHGLWKRANAQVAEEIGRAYLLSRELEPAREFLRESCASERTFRRVVMLALAHTHPRLVDVALDWKRTIALRRNNCSKISITPHDIPGFDD